MRVNSEAIYGTTASPFKEQLAWGRCTQKNGNLYLHVFDWPVDGRLRVRLVDKDARAWLLAEPSRELKCVSDANGLVVQVPATAPDKISSLVVLRPSSKAEGLSAQK